MQIEMKTKLQFFTETLWKHRKCYLSLLSHTICVGHSACLSIAIEQLKI